MSAALLSTDFIALGILRLLALVINGTFADTWYGRWTHHVRGFLALYSLYVWTTIDSRLLLPIIIIEFSNLALAFGDSGAADRRFKNAAAEH
ncbi:MULTISPECIES: hypothetical protein [unclassified Beijerinckia]|uniref:hypothetical protein n=1 Tax=unclassified Beijerinckia TaxID=2638183 RepID=UPI0011147ACB|nr:MULTISPECIES: hypothetical protein [unclassified Beijerinckia]